MSALVDVAIRSSLVLAAALAVLPLLGRQPAALRHGLLGAALVAASLVGPASRIAPAWTMDVPVATSVARWAPAPFAAGDATLTLPAALEPRLPDTGTVIVAVWLTGVLAGLGALLVSLLRLQRLSSRAEPVNDPRWTRLAEEMAAGAGLGRQVELRQASVPGLLGTFGVRRPRLLVPAGAGAWPEPRIRAVLAHEMAHVARRDWPVQVTAEALRALHWYNPLFWIACRRLRLESERACDDAVLRAGVATVEYAQHLFDIARLCRAPRAAPRAAMPMARPSTLRRRITAMLHPRSRHHVVSRPAIVLVALVVAGLAVPTAALRGTPDGPLPVSGHVFDATGAVLPGASLTLKEQDGPYAWEAETDGTGRFEFPAVAAGRYELAVAVPGFRAFRQVIVLSHASDWRRAITLQVGAVQESITVRERRPATAPAPSAGPARLRVGGNVRAPLKVRDVKPVYPATMRDAGMEGTVPLEAIIDRTGTVQSVRVLTAGVHPDFAVAATEAVRQWKFQPTLLNGDPVEVVMTAIVTFALED